MIGMRVRRTGEQAVTPVGESLLGRIVTPLGRPLDTSGPVHSAVSWQIERPAPPILDRAPVRRALLTGIKAIDAAIPVGRGQRELILGDRQTGKTSIAVDTIINQDKDVISVYCAIGQRQSSVARVVKKLRDAGVLRRCIIVIASGEDLPGLRYLAPYAATSMAEYFMESGRDVLIIYDDLTKHARSYRELSLLLRRPPGREAYPGDIFYLHARLLERATQLNKERGGGSMTALPIIETQGQIISAYIPTNLISITDGQVFLSTSHFAKGMLPAIDIGGSVSRVGAKAQPRAFLSVAPDLRPLYAQFEELETFARFGTRLDEVTQQRLVRGRRVREVFKQDEGAPIDVRGQVAILLAATRGLLDSVPMAQLPEAETHIQDRIAGSSQPFWLDFDPAQPISQAAQLRMKTWLKSVVSDFLERLNREAMTDGNA